VWDAVTNGNRVSRILNAAHAASATTGKRFYKTPAEFQQEGRSLGFSRRIKSLPRQFKVGETWVLLAHPKTIETLEPIVTEGTQAVIGEQMERVWKPGIFTLWRPSRIEKILSESQRDTEETQKLIEQGITPVFVPDDDKDHQGTVYDKEAEEETEEIAEVVV